jgi:tetratricopeptide (TPR) repeat protein
LKIVALFILLATAFGCRQSEVKYPMPSLALKWNAAAMELVRFLDDKDSSRKALDLLDRATDIDSSYFDAHFNKVMFACSLGEYGVALSAVHNAIRLKPEAHDLFLISGVLQRRVGDTVGSRNSFVKSLSICSSALDTMHATNGDYLMMKGNRILLYTMLNRKDSANYFLNELEEVDKSSETFLNLREVVNSEIDTVVSKMLDTRNYRR